MKRAISVLLSCLLLCGLAIPAAFAADSPIDVSGAVPLALNVATKLRQGAVYSFTAAETGWVKFAIAVKQHVGVGFNLFDDELNQIVKAAYTPTPTVKLMAGKTYYISPDISDGQQTYVETITPSRSGPPVIKPSPMKVSSVFSGSSRYRPFQADGYVGWTYTVNGQEPSAFKFEYSDDCFMYTLYTENGTYTLQFTNYDGEDLGTLTVIIEDWTPRGWLADILKGVQDQWNNEDKTTQEWLKSIGNDLLLMVSSPVVALMILFMGPMGWVLLPVAFTAFGQLFVDIGGFVTSIFR